jgi:hypothetical protein
VFDSFGGDWQGNDLPAGSVVVDCKRKTRLQSYNFSICQFPAKIVAGFWRKIMLLA